MKTSSKLKKRTIIEILRDSLDDKTYNEQIKTDNALDDTQNEVRYKLIIDQSEDESATRLLFMFGILKCENTRVYMCSNFPGDSQLRKVITSKIILHIMFLILIDQHNCCYQTFSYRRSHSGYESNR